MDRGIDFGELANDENFKSKILELNENIDHSAEILNKYFSTSNYDNLSAEDKVRYDLLLAYAINTYYWIYLRINGIDPSNHEIKHQISRVRDYMSTSKKIYEKNTIMPKIDKGAAQRFVRNSLWNPNSSTQTSEQSTSQLTESSI